MNALAVTIDSREPPNVIASLSNVGEVATTVAPLPFGDAFIITSDGAALLVERKAPNDLLSSIMDGRLFSQVAGMRGITPWCYVAVTGPILPDQDAHCWVDGRQTNFSWHSLQGALQTAQELGAIVIWTNGPSDYLPCLNRLITRSRGDVRIGALRAGVVVPIGESILASLPGVGPEHAHAVIEYAGTAALGFSFLSGGYQMGAIPGIGLGTRQKVRNALGLNSSECLHVVMLDEKGEPDAHKQTRVSWVKNSAN